MEPPVHSSLEEAHQYQKLLINKLLDYHKYCKKLTDEVDKLKIELLKYRGH